MTSYTICNHNKRFTALVDLIHDGKLDSDHILYDEDRRELHLSLLLTAPPYKVVKTFWPFSRYYYQYRKAEMVIGDVAEFRISDSARIGNVDVNEVEFDGEILTISSPMPFRLTVRVRSLLLVLNISAELLEGGYYKSKRGYLVSTPVDPETILEGPDADAPVEQ